MSDRIEKLLLKQADEIADDGHAGWGNTMRDAAAELTAMRESHARLLDAMKTASKLLDAADCPQCGET